MRIWFFLICLVAAPAAAAADLMAEMQAFERTRGAAIAADDEIALAKLYAPSFTGVTAGGTQVDRAALFAIFRRAHAQRPLAADSTVLSARAVGGAVAVVTDA